MTLSARIIVRSSRAALWCRRLGALAVPTLAIGAVGHRGGWIGAEAVLPVLTLGIGLALAALTLALIAVADIWTTGANGLRDAVIGVVYAAPALVLFAAAGVGVALYPRLTDISTDTMDVPEFTSPVASGEAEADRVLQLESYPEITARLYPVSLEQAYAAANALVEQRGWTVTRAVEPIPEPLPDDDVLGALVAEAGGVAPPVSGMVAADVPTARDASIEAVATTLLFAFPDDVLIRLIGGDDGTRVDMRSASRIGTHDLGQNARRIRRFFTDLDALLQGMADAEPAGPSPQSPGSGSVPPPRPMLQ